MKKYEKGDKVWYIFGDLLIQCTISDTRKDSPKAWTHYYLDEPVGHAVYAEDFYASFKDAKRDFRAATRNTKKYFVEEKVPYRGMKLPTWRRTAARFILSTHLPGKKWGKRGLVAQSKIKKFLSSYSSKKKNVEWFSGKELFKL